MANIINRDRYNALNTVLRMRGDIATVCDTQGCLSDDLTWGVSWKCMGATSPATAYDTANALADAADIATVLNDMALTLLWEGDIIFEPYHADEELLPLAKERYKELVDLIRRAIDDKDWDWLEAILTDGNRR